MRYGDQRDEMFNVTAQQLFKSVNDVIRLEIRIRVSKEKVIKKRFVLSHFPFASWEDMNNGVIHLHGHLHLEEALKLHEGRSIDVGVDGADYSPYIFQSIVSIMRDRPVAYTVLRRDHHLTKREDNEPSLEG
jgi:calcineurin-like phosphoesterase family protein